MLVKSPASDGIPLVAWVLVAAGCLATAVKVLPVGISRDTDVPMTFLALGAAAGGFGIASDTRLRGSLRAGPGTRVALATCGVLGALIVSTALAASPAAATFGAPGSSLGLITLVALLAYGLEAAVAGRSVGAALRAAAPWVMATQIVAVLGELAIQSPASGTLSNSTYLSEVLLLLLPFVVAPALEAGSRRAAWRWELGAAAVLALGLSGARVGFALGLIGLAWLGWLAVRSANNEATARFRRRVAFAAGVLAAAIALVLVFAIPKLGATLNVADQLGTRPDMWPAAWTLFTRAPLAGHGPDSFRVAVAPLASVRQMVKEGSAVRDFGTLSADPHDTLLAVLSQLGILGVVALGWLAFELVRARTRGGVRGSPGAGLAAVLYVGSVLLAPAPLETLPLLALVVAAAVPIGAVEAPAGRGEVDRVRSRAPWVLAGLAGLALLALALTRLYVGPQPQTGRPVDTRSVTTAAALWRVEPFFYYLESWRLTASGAYDSRTADPTRMLGTIRRATALEPANPFYALDEARVLDDIGADHAETRRAFERALALFPNSPEANEDFADFLVRDGTPKQALPLAQRALEVAPAQADAYTAASAVYRALGDTVTAGQLAERAATLSGRRWR